MNKILLLILALIISVGIHAQTDLIISEYVEGWATNKALEIYNPTSVAINLKDYQLVRYANGEDVPPAADDWKVALPDAVIEPYKTFVCVIDKRDPEGTGQEAPVWEQLQVRADVFLCANYAISNTLYHNGDDALALEKNDGTLVDLFARWGDPRPAEAVIGGSELSARCWTDTAPFFNGVGAGITSDHTLVRKPDIINGVTVNPGLFNPLEHWDSLSANTFDHLGWHVSSVSPANATPTFSQNTFDFNISKNEANGAVLGSVVATDAENDALRYYINSGNFIYNDNGTEDATDDIRLVPFELNRETGEISVKDASAFQYSLNDSVYINISVNDGFTESESITVNALLTDGQVGFSIISNDLFAIFPNPVQNKLNISSVKTMSSLSILNVSGQVVKQIAINASHTEINIEEMANGIYFIEAQFSDKTTGLKRIVKK